MPRAGAPTLPVRLLKAGGLVVTAALIALMLHAGAPTELWWWPLACLFGLWIVGPALVPWWLARKAMSRRRARWTLVAYLGVSTALSAYAYHDAFFVSKSSTAALAMIFVPLCQWAALIVVGAACLLLDRHGGARSGPAT